RLAVDQIEGQRSLTSRGRRVVWAVVAAVLAAGLAVGIWSAVAADPAATSANGCVSVNVPSTTGGGLLHHCGQDAVAFCRMAFTAANAVALAARPQCDLAGLTKAKVTAAR
ncbi:MAG TPA: hypothetical protein VHF26_04550, partial [Trebonia sp.]|nr:hypothetical protein [Trebonia sp.]